MFSMICPLEEEMKDGWFLSSLDTCHSLAMIDGWTFMRTRDDTPCSHFVSRVRCGVLVIPLMETKFVSRERRMSRAFWFSSLLYLFSDSMKNRHLKKTSIPVPDFTNHVHVVLPASKERKYNISVCFHELQDSISLH